MKKDKTITIETLAGMVQKGFEGVDKQFMVTNEEIRFLGGKIDGIEMELMDIKKRLDNVVYRHEYEILKERVVLLEKKIKLK